MAKNEQEKPKWDPNPILAFAVRDNGDGTHTIQHWPAFDPQYGPESERQIEWHQRRGTPGVETWRVGVPCPLRGGRFVTAKEEQVAA